MKNFLSEMAVSHSPNTRWLGKQCQILPAVDSTNDLLKEMMQQGDADLLPTALCC